MSLTAGQPNPPGPQWQVGAQEPFIAAHRLPHEADAATISRFGDDVWVFTPLIPKHEQRKTVAWNSFAAPLRQSWRRITWVFTNLPTPAELLDRANSPRVQWPSGASVHTMTGDLRRFDHWLTHRGITSLDDIDEDVLLDYGAHIAGLHLSMSRSTAALYTVSRIWGAAPHLPPGDRIPMPPWENTDLTDYLPGVRAHSNENSTKPIHPAVMSPLLIWSLRFAEDFADDIISAWNEYQRLNANITTAFNPQATPALTALLDQAATGQILLPGRSTSAEGTTVAATYLAGMHATSAEHVTYLLSRRPALTASRSSPLNSPIKGRLHDQPWKTHIDFFEAPVLMRLLQTACMVITAYLSGLRPAEILNLRTGCCPPPADTGATMSYQIHGNFFKGTRSEHGEPLPDGQARTIPWTVIQPVAQAISVLERIGTPPFLFDIGDPWNNQPSGRTSGRTTAVTATKRIRRLSAWVNTYTASNNLLSESIPEDPGGPILLSRFRRTIAWHISRLPQGRIALAIQYGHLRAIQSDAYGARSREGLRRVVDIESAMSIADFLQDLADRLETGEGVSGPAAIRMIEAARQRTARFEGMFLAERDLKAMLINPQFQVFDNPQAFLTCNKDPDKALCDPDREIPAKNRPRPPALDRCDPACANIARTDTHIQAIHHEIKHLEQEAGDPLTPIPLATRQSQRIQTLQAMITRHERTRMVTTTNPTNGSREQQRD